VESDTSITKFMDKNMDGIKKNIKKNERSEGKKNNVFGGYQIALTGCFSDRQMLIDSINNSGGRFCNIVSKKISFLIATKDSLLDNTQRIRKAIKFDKPIISEEFIHQCILQNKLLDIKDFELRNIKV